MEIRPWIVAESEGRIVGYAYATQWRERRAYRFSVESTVYLASDAIGAGIGSALYASLLDRLQQLDVRCVIGGIALPNSASVALHEKLGFVKVAQFEKVGWKQDRWIDVGYWQKVFCDVMQPQTLEAD
jgi:L-amino acid N-acyltransferase YncA